jgi:hypothetical protein
LLLIDPDATRLRGRGFLYERENHYGDKEGNEEGNKEGNEEVHEEIPGEEEQCEEVEFIAQVQPIGG